MAEGFTLTNVVPKAMADTNFGSDSAWNSSVHIPKQHAIILAPSGSGKTSLLSFMYGMRNDYTGTISFEGKNLSDERLYDWSKLRQQKLSVIFQDLRLVPHLTVGENLILKNNLTKFKSIDEIKSMLNQLGVGDKWDQTCGTLSYGQQQRVCIVRSLLQPFSFLLADEPFSHMDDANIILARELMLNECAKQNAALLFFSLGDSYGINFNHQFKL